MSEAPDWAADIVPRSAEKPHADHADWAADIVPPSVRTKPHEGRIISAPLKTQSKPLVKVPEPELTLGETVRQAVRNTPHSIMETGQSLADAVAHPIKTATGIGDILKGGASQLAGMAGIKQDPTNKAHTEALISALEDQYKEKYGSVRGFKKALAADPVSILMDASTFAGGAGLGAKAAGLTKAASTLGKASSLLDPVARGVWVARQPMRAVKFAQSVTTGRSVAALRKAAEAGASADPEMRAAFRTHLSGKADPQEVIVAANKALDDITRERGERYVTEKAKITGGQLPPIPWSPVEKALKRNVDEVMFTPTVSGTSRVVNKKAADALKEIGEEIDFYKSQPVGSNAHTIEGFDALKKRVGDIRNDVRNDPVAHQKATAMYNSVLDAIKDQHPDYAQIMAHYAKASDQIQQIGATFSLGKKSRAQKVSILNKLVKAGDNGMKSDMLAQLAEKDPRIPYMIAGQELSPITPQGLRGAMVGLGALPVYAANPIAGAVHIAALSPRLAGTMNYGAGRVGKLLDKAPVAARPAYYADKAFSPVGALAEEEPNTELTSQHTGDDVWKRMVTQESGGKQSDADGNLITSAAGAGGYAQLMPATAKAMAAEMGKPELAELAFQPTEEGRQASEEIGHYYFGKLLEQFGDPLHAAAAYNAGPDAVARALTKSKEDGSSWIEHLPDETKNYVRIVSRGEFASGGKVNGVAIGPLVDRLMSMAKQAKRTENKHTKPLLGASDDSVARALQVAQREI